MWFIHTCRHCTRKKKSHVSHIISREFESSENGAFWTVGQLPMLCQMLLKTRKQKKTSKIYTNMWETSCNFKNEKKSLSRLARLHSYPNISWVPDPSNRLHPCLPLWFWVAGWVSIWVAWAQKTQRWRIPSIDFLTYGIFLSWKLQKLCASSSCRSCHFKTVHLDCSEYKQIKYNNTMKLSVAMWLLLQSRKR